MPPTSKKNENEVNAFKAMKALGFSERVVKPVLHKLLKLFNNEWSPIEEEYYHVLLDAIYQEREDKEEGSRNKKACVSYSSPEDSKPLSKRFKLCLKQKNNHASSSSQETNYSLTRLGSRNLKKLASKPEASRPPPKRLQSKHQKVEVLYESEDHGRPVKRSRSSNYALKSSPLSHQNIQEDSSESEEIPLKRRPRLRNKNKQAPSDTPLERAPSKHQLIQYSSEPEERRSDLRQMNEEASSRSEDHKPLIQMLCLKHKKALNLFKSKPEDSKALGGSLHLKHKCYSNPGLGDTSSMGQQLDDVELTRAHYKGTIVESSQFLVENQPYQFRPLLPLPHASNKGTSPDSPETSLKRKRKRSSQLRHVAKIAGYDSLSPQVSPMGKISNVEGESRIVCFNELEVELGKFHPVETMIAESSEALIMPKRERISDESQHEASLAISCEDVPIDMCEGNIEGSGLGNSEPMYLDWEDKGYNVSASSQLEIAATPKGEVKLGLICDISQQSGFHIPKFDDVFKIMEDKFIKSYGITEPSFSVMKFMEDLCQCCLSLGTAPTAGKQLMSIHKTNPAAPEGTSRTDVLGGRVKLESNFCIPPGFTDGVVKFQNYMVVVEKIAGPMSVNKLEMLQCIAGVNRNVIEDMQGEGKKKIEVLKSLDSYVSDITRGKETVKISLVNEITTQRPPSFFYMTENRIYKNASMNFALANISCEDCCSRCYGDCLASAIPCMCTRECGTGFAYKAGRMVKDKYVEECISLNHDPRPHRSFCRNDCALERFKSGKKSHICKGHLVRKFIKECWCKCGCSKDCGNRIVQQGITVTLQVFMTPEGKGWGLRTLEGLAKGAFVCEFVGEIITIMELDERNRERSGTHTYTVLLDAGWTCKGDLEDNETLCLDATSYGNVTRFINHRCSDANLAAIPVEVETPDHSYYHLAFFTTRNIAAMEELSWDYGIDFNGDNHAKAFECHCGSKYCRGPKLSKGTKCSSDFQDKEFLRGVFLQNIFPRRKE